MRRGTNIAGNAVFWLALVGVLGGLGLRPPLGAQPIVRWKVVAEETFEALSLPAGGWLPDDHPTHQRDDGTFGDWGEFHRVKRGVNAPHGYRISARFGKDGWLTVEAFSRSISTSTGSLFAQVPDPDSKRVGNHVLRIASPLHTDGTVIRPTNPLPSEYRVCVKVGYASFGDGIAGAGRQNGYLGTETDPWKMWNPIKDNGFYWLAIIDDVPRPRNNVWIHHHRKVVIDSDNNQDAWSEVWNGRTFINSGYHPIFMLVHDREGPEYEDNGKPYIPFAAGRWQPSDTIRAVDVYKDRTWYTACIGRISGQYWLSMAGEFQYGGNTAYSAAIPVTRVFHGDIGPGGWPEYFMFGDPHTNYYRGEVYYDDLRLEVPAP